VQAKIGQPAKPCRLQTSRCHGRIGSNSSYLSFVENGTSFLVEPAGVSRLTNDRATEDLTGFGQESLGSGEFEVKAWWQLHEDRPALFT
jgi:hypothetical protein